MEAFTVRENRNGGQPIITRGIIVSGRNRVSLGSIDREVFGIEHVPLSIDLQQKIGEDELIANASVMRAPTGLKFLATEKIEGDKAGAVLVRISVAPPDGHMTELTKPEITTQNCSYRGWTNNEPKVCEGCGLEYAEEKGNVPGPFKHPAAGHVQLYSEHLTHNIKTIGHSPHINKGHQTHNEMLLIMEPGARIRIAIMKDKQLVAEHVLVRTHTELAFALPGDIYLPSELAEANAAYV